MYEIILTDEFEAAIANEAKEYAIKLEVRAIEIALSRRLRNITDKHVIEAAILMGKWEER